MGFKKHSTLPLDTDSAQRASASEPFTRTGKLADFEFSPEPGFMYVTTRAISSRVNANNDGWPPDELRRAYKTFIGRPVYVDHNNWDLKRSRGVIIDSKLYENKLASGHEDVWVQLLIEVDAQAFPRLAQSIMTGDIDAVSMGADVEYTICSVCSNRARDVLQYCAHIPQLKGREVAYTDTKTGSTIKKLCYEDCYGVSFFEISFVFDPADESALISDVMLASKETNRALAHVRGPRETIAAYSGRVGTSLHKVSRTQAPEFCTTCGSHSQTFTRSGSVCKLCGAKTADRALMSLPQEVDTLRDELNCPQCGSEWNGMVCLNCGFELPPEGLGDPSTDPFGLNMPMGQQGDQEQGEQDEEKTDESQDSDSPTPRDKADAKRDDDDSSGSNPFSKSDKDKDSDKKGPPSKSDKSKSDKSKGDSAKSKDNAKSNNSKDKKDNDKSDAKKKKSSKEELVSRFADLQKEATLPQAPVYRQDTSPAQSVPPYGQAIPGGNPTAPPEPALEPAQAPPAQLQNLDNDEVVAPIGQSEVDVVGQPEGPVTTPPPGAQVGEMLRGRSAAAEDELSPDEQRRVAFFTGRAEQLERKAAILRKRAETVYQTDVRALDEPPPVDLGADATVNVQAPTQEADQLALADSPAAINDGRETGLPDVRDRLRNQTNPFNDAALTGYSPPNQQVASVDKEAAKCAAGCECPDGSCDCGSCSSSKTSSKIETTNEEAKLAAEAEQHDSVEQRIAAAKTRVIRIANFVDERIAMGLATPNDKVSDISRFEEMDDKTLDGYIQATREFKAKESRVANRRVRVASADGRNPVRLPSLGSVSRPVEDEGEPADDYLAFMG